MKKTNVPYNKGLLYEYIRVRQGKKDEKGKDLVVFSKLYFGADRKKSEANAIELFRMVVEIFLRWTPKDCQEHMSRKIIEIMKLNDIYEFLPFPAYLDRNVDYWYIAHILYPEVIPFSSKQLTLEVYKKILSKESTKFPKKFFDSADGKERACICLNYYIDNYETFHSSAELYSYFASSPGRLALDNHGFRNVWNQLFGSPVAFVHEALSDEDKDEYLFHYYEFEYQFTLQGKNEKKSKNIERKILKDKKG
jgi:hypothetical protein